jgi:hypothetical protein
MRVPSGEIRTPRQLSSGELQSMEWRPIKQYDAMKGKPRLVVFFVAEDRTSRYVLPQTLSFQRTMGFRTITHFCVLPEAPK